MVQPSQIYPKGEIDMKLNKNLGMILLAVYLILVGIAGLGIFSLPPIITAILALAAGILLIINR
jgi:amino acid transporter